MNKTVLAVANYHKRKYFIEPKFSKLPVLVKKDIKAICVKTAERLCGVFEIGFYDSGVVYIDLHKSADDENNSDEATIAAEIERVIEENEQLLRSLRSWYVTVYNP